VTLEEDLVRRDFTINAMAQDEEGRIIDLFHGQEDLKNKILRHTSLHFSEDPLRVLRAIRFKTILDFSIAPETLLLIKKINESGEMKHLSLERVWQEVVKSLPAQNPMHFLAIYLLSTTFYFLIFKFNDQQVEWKKIDSLEDRWAVICYLLQYKFDLPMPKSFKQTAQRFSYFMSCYHSLHTLNAEQIWKVLNQLKFMHNRNNIMHLAYLAELIHPNLKSFKIFKQLSSIEKEESFDQNYYLDHINKILSSD
jgi:tRNA nucleotidyltransferase/poly(A) polymerase